MSGGSSCHAMACNWSKVPLPKKHEPIQDGRHAQEEFGVPVVPYESCFEKQLCFLSKKQMFTKSTLISFSHEQLPYKSNPKTMVNFLKNQAKKP